MTIAKVLLDEDVEECAFGTGSSHCKVADQTFLIYGIGSAH